MLRQNPDADLPGCHADDEGENDRSLITSDTKTRPLKPGTDCQIEFRLIHLIGANDTHIATLVERNTRFTMLVKIPRKDTTTVVAALAKHISKLPEELRRSLTWDQGKEMHAHKRFTVATNVQVYFCDPRSPWQRGSNENTNGLLRQYLPRGTDFSRISQSYLNAIALRLNQRPRKTLGFQTPADRLQAALH